MNILEHYIEEIHSVKPYTEEWTKEFPDRKFVEVDVTSNCWGCVERQKHVWTVVELAKHKEQGYFWG